MIVIRYNPDNIKHKGKAIKIDQITRLQLLVGTIKKQLSDDCNGFCVELIQLYYSDDNVVEYITKQVCV